LWTGQYEECKSVIEEGKPQSMELDEENLNGHWSTDSKTGMDFFIINDAIFSKLCILGEDVEPCFEGSSITAPEVSNTFSKIDNDFKRTLYTMMQDLKFALEGGQKMDIEQTETIQETEVVEEETTLETPVEEETTEAVETVEEEEKTEEEISNEVDNEDQSALADNDNSIEVESSQETFAKKEEDEDKESDNEDPEDSEDDKEEEEDKYSLLETNYEKLQAEYSDLETKYQALVEFKNQIEDEKKDTLINSFYMLSDEDKADVIANKSSYSLEDIEAKLSVICVRKKVNFNLDETSKKEENADTDVVTYNINTNEGTDVPGYIAALRHTRDSRK
jgi:hypothetical protein